jgi:hypothetical protein
LDTLDGKITERSFEEKAGAWREEQKKILAKMEALQNSSQTYIEEGTHFISTPIYRQSDIPA